MAQPSRADSGPTGPQEPTGTRPEMDAILGANPFVSLNSQQAVRALGRWAESLLRHPTVLASEALLWGSDELRILAGASPIAPDPKDKRFTDSAWQGRVWGRVAQSYLATRASLLRSVDEVGLDPKSVDRARFALSQLTEAMAPTNSLLGNPAALKKAWRTRGRSLVDGTRHLAHDIQHNRGMPSQVDSRPFRVGETVAVTPGAVVHRGDVFELLQYQPVTAEVASLPMVVIPPQINRYWFLDMAPGRSFVEYCVNQGISVFMVSWRNPQAEHRHWNLETYAEACLEAVGIAAHIFDTEQVNVIGFCSGGMTTAGMLSALNQQGDHVVNAAGMAVSLIDTGARSSLNMFMSEETMKSSLARSRRNGILDGHSLGRVFSWMRPNDLVWNYWVSNYLMGQNPPAFDVLAWNADGTNMPAGLHADFMHIWKTNAMIAEGEIELLGSPLDLSAVKNDMYVVGAQSDHLVPWESAYAATQAFSGAVRFVLSRSGHIQALVNPPDNPKASFYLNPERPQSAREWLADATTVSGSWWTDWTAWILERSGQARPSRTSLGNSRYPVLDSAPGRYVHE